MNGDGLEPEFLLAAYARGIFPMADRDGSISFYSADPRGIIPLDTFHVPQTLRQLLRKDPPVFEIRVNHDFAATMRACMTEHTDGTWINEKLISAYTRLHRMGFAHSVEAWAGGRLVGGLYGVTLGAAFFGESMFHRQRDASKAALVFLVNRLRERHFELLDSQATTTHLRRFGAIDIPAAEYLRRLRGAIIKSRSFV